MGRQRKNPQSKGMEDSPVKELNEMEASKLSDTCLLYTSDAADDYLEV